MEAVYGRVKFQHVNGIGVGCGWCDGGAFLKCPEVGGSLSVCLWRGVCGLVLRSLASLQVTWPPLTFFLPEHHGCFLPSAFLFFFFWLVCPPFPSICVYSIVLSQVFELDTLANDFPLFLFSSICICTTLLRYNLYIVHLFEVYNSFSIFRIVQPSSPSEEAPHPPTEQVPQH